MRLARPASTARAPRPNRVTCCRPAVPPPPGDGAPIGATADGLGDGEGEAEGPALGVGVPGRAEPEPEPEPEPPLAVPEPGALAVKKVADPEPLGLADPVARGRAGGARRR